MQSSHDALRRNIYCRSVFDVITLKMGELSKQLHQAPFFGEDTDVIVI